MADATWPLPDRTYLDVNGYTEAEPKNAIVQTMDVGPPKARRRSTAKPRPITGQMVMDLTEFNTFSTWYNDTLFSGVLSFDGLPHPRTRLPVDWRFQGDPPTYVPLGQNGTKFVVTMKLLILP